MKFRRTTEQIAFAASANAHKEVYVSLQTDGPPILVDRPSQLVLADMGHEQCERGWYRLPVGGGLPVTLPLTSIQVGDRLFPILGYSIGHGPTPWHTIRLAPAIAGELEEYLQDQGYRLPMAALIGED